LQARILNGERHPERIVVLEHHVLTKLGLADDADLLFERYGEHSPDLHLMQANLSLHRAERGDITREEADAQRLALVDWTFEQHGLIPISQLVTSRPLTFSSISADKLGGETSVTDAQRTQPTVSIVVPAYNAESTLATSVNSLRAQTVRNIEILIVDDGSTDNTYANAKALASEDDRIRVIQHAENLGAYGARNTGLAHATGEFFTVHDADDWSHPQLLERQLQALSEPEIVGSCSRLVRVTPDLEFVLRPYRPMLEPIHWNYTSLLVKTETLRAFGGWDRVRAHADSDLFARLREYFGDDCIVEVDTAVPLSLFMVSGDNLTEARATSLRSVDFGARREYSEQAQFWRRTTFQPGEIPTYADRARRSSAAPFYCPRSLAPDRDRISHTFDLVLGSDLGLIGGTRNCNIAYLKCAKELGLRVGIFNMPRYRMRRSGWIDDAYRELLQAGDVELITPEDDVKANVLLVHHPPVLRKLFDRYPRIKAKAHYLLVNQLPWQMKDYTDIQYSADVVRGHFHRAFDAEALWIPITPRVRTYLTRAVEADLMYDEDWYPIVPWQIAPTSRLNSPTRPVPVVGRHSRDHFTKWPEAPEVLKKCYLADTQHEVRLLGGAKAAEKILGYRPRNWQVLPFDSIAVKEFLRRVDVFLHFHHSMYLEEFGRNVAEAMADGVPCVLPSEYSETFLDAAIYAEPDTLEDVIGQLWSDPQRYRDYSERGEEFVRQHSGMDAGMRRVTRLLDG
jgi:glycosyltransferase involved in cell wall biosynthesis